VSWSTIQHLAAIAAAFLGGWASFAQATRSLEKAAAIDGDVKLSLPEALCETLLKLKPSHKDATGAKHFHRVAVLWWVIGLAALLTCFAEILDFTI
jgi:hypothetical protein